MNKIEYTVNTYAELEKWSKAFVDGAFNLFFLIGHPGQAKSRTLRRLMTGTPKPDAPVKGLWVEGGALSAFKFYMDLYRHRHQTVVLDDVDSIYTDRSLVRMMKCLCQSEEVKRLGWHTNNQTLQDAGIPDAFETRSRVCIIANRWNTMNEHVGSLLDRGMMIHFRPSPDEVQRYARTFFPDKEILKFADPYIGFLDELSLRDYIVAAQAKVAGLEWQKALLRRFGLYEVLTIHELMNDPTHPTIERRVTEFMNRTGLSRPKFFDYRKLWEEKFRDILPKPKKAKTKAKPKKKAVAAK